MTLAPPSVAAFKTALLSLDRVSAARLLDCEGSGRPAVSVVERLVVPALEEIGTGWEAGTVALSQVYMSAKICEELMAGIPHLNVPFRPDRPRIAIVTLEDHHLLGKRMVQSMLRASGFAVADYGTLDVPSLADRALEDHIDILLVSVLMLRSALNIESLRHRLDINGQRPRLVVGGAPFRFDPMLWREVGADACGRTASAALTLVEHLYGEPR
jgi:methanogenic corrinoid protein MtbC1